MVTPGKQPRVGRPRNILPKIRVIVPPRQTRCSANAVTVRTCRQYAVTGVIEAGCTAAAGTNEDEIAIICVVKGVPVRRGKVPLPGRNVDAQQSLCEAPLRANHYRKCG